MSLASDSRYPDFVLEDLSGKPLDHWGLSRTGVWRSPESSPQGRGYATLGEALTRLCTIVKWCWERREEVPALAVVPRGDHSQPVFRKASAPASRPPLYVAAAAPLQGCVVEAVKMHSEPGTVYHRGLLLVLSDIEGREIRTCITVTDGELDICYP